MSAPAVRTIPIRLDPLPGESFDSWLLAYAARLEIPLSEIGAATALPPGFVHQPPRFIALGHHLGDTEGLAHATGVDRQALDQMWAPLARYNDAVKPRLAKSGLVRVVVPLAWSRFCPPCLATNGNRWPASWRLAWHTTCDTHRCFLVDGCPACGRHQRQHPSVDTATDPRLRCTARTPGRPSSETCGHDLTTEQAPADADLVHRTTAFEVAVAPAHDPDAPESTRHEALDVLADVLLIARQLDGTASLDPHRSVGPADIGAVLAQAWEVYVGKAEENPSRPLIRDAHYPGVLPPGWSAASPTLVARVLTPRDSSMRTTDRLRWRTTTAPRRPTEDGLRNARERARRVPDALWADWAIRLTPRVGVEARSFRMAAAAALLIPGTSQPLAEVFGGTGHDGRARSITHSLGLIPPGDSRAVLGALNQLADSIDRWGFPIDYQRRRDLASSVDLLGDVTGNGSVPQPGPPAAAFASSTSPGSGSSRPSPAVFSTAHPPPSDPTTNEPPSTTLSPCGCPPRPPSSSTSVPATSSPATASRNHSPGHRPATGSRSSNCQAPKRNRSTSTTSRACSAPAGQQGLSRGRSTSPQSTFASPSDSTPSARSHDRRRPTAETGTGGLSPKS